MTDRPNCELTLLESDRWQLRGPLTLWQYESGAGWTVGNHIVQLCGLGSTPEEALDDYCRHLIEFAEGIERQRGRLLEIMEPIGQSWQVTATEDSIAGDSIVRGVTSGVTDCTQEEARYV